MMNKFKNGLGHSLVLAGMCLAMLLFMSHKSVAQEVGEVGYMYTPDAQTTFRYVITAAADGEGNGGEVAVRKYNDAVSGAIEIPSSVTIDVGGTDITYSVTSVRADGFKNCASITSVTLPSSVTAINTNAFENCTSLASVSLVGSGVTSIGQNAFGSCSALTSVTFNDALSTIGRRAFRSSGLTSVTIPSSTSIGNGAFSNCESLTSVTIQDGITSIGDSVFELSNLASVTFPSSVTSIGNYAFASCPLTSQGTLDLSNVTSLGNGAFQTSGSGGITSVTFSSSLTTIPQNAFRGRGLTSVTIPSSVTSISNCAFENCTGLTSIDLGTGLTSIGAYAFASCPLTSQGTLDLSNVTSLGEGAFQTSFGGGITSVTFSSSLTSIPQNCFRGRVYLTSITIPASVTSIGSDAFYGCYTLANIYFKRTGSTPTFSNPVFGQLVRNVTTFHVPSGMLDNYKTALGWTTTNDAYYNTAYSNLYIIVEGDGNALVTADGIIYKVLNANNRTAEVWRNSNVSGSKTIASSVSGFGSGDETSQSYEVTAIGANAFRGSDFNTVVLPATLNSIGEDAFKNATNLRYITFNGATPPTLANDVLDNTSGLEYIYVPCLNVETYKNATSWTSYIASSKLAKIKPIRSGEAIPSTLTSDLKLTGEDCNCKAIPSTLTISNNASLSFEDYTNFVAAMKDVTINVEKELNVDEWNLISALNGTRVGETYAFLDNNLGQTDGVAHAMAAVPYDFGNNGWDAGYVSRTDNTPIASQSFMVYPVNVALTTDGNAGTVSEDLNETKITLTQTISGNAVNEKNNIYIPLTTDNSQKWYPLANPYLGRLNLNKFHTANAGNLQDNYAWIFKDGDWESVDISGATNYAVYPASGFLVSLPEISSETTLNMHVNQIVTNESVTMKSTEGNNKITLSATNNGVEKEIYAHIDEVSDNGYGRLDAKVMFSSNEDAVNPYFNVEGRNIFDNYFSQLPAEYELNFNSYKNNQIDFALKEEISEVEVTLIDIANNNAETVLSVNEPVQIDLTEGQNEGRYRLRFAPKNSNINDVVSSENSINIWNRLSEINISGKDLKRVEIFNTLGQKVYHSQLSGDSATFNSNLSDGAYIVKVYTQSSIKSKKVIIR